MPDTHNEWETHKKGIRDEYKRAILSANHEVDADMALYNALDKALTFCETSLRKEWAGKVRELRADIHRKQIGSAEYQAGSLSAYKRVIALIESITWSHTVSGKNVALMSPLSEPDSST